MRKLTPHPQMTYATCFAKQLGRGYVSSEEISFSNHCSIQIKVEVISSTTAKIHPELLATSQEMCITINIHRGFE